MSLKKTSTFERVLRGFKQAAALRHRLKQSQAGFARLLKVSVCTVQAWEQEALFDAD